MKLNEKIVKLRKKNGLSQEDLANKMNVSRQAVSRWEHDTALPDANNILQLSKLFGVTADYLLNDDYESDFDVPAIKETKQNADKKEKNIIQKIIGICAASAGTLGNFIIYIISRFVKVSVPRITYDETGQKWYTYGGFEDYSYKYFIQEHNLEFLSILFLGIMIVGIALIFIKNENISQWINFKRRKKDDN